MRVREVGVGRHERRAARRERERQQAAQAVGTASSSHMPSASTGEIPEDTLNAEDIANQPDPTSTNTNEATNDSSTPLDGLPQPSAEQGQPQPEQPAFSTFQQLMYIPPVPASVLAPAYVIPPTYSSVIQSNPMPEQAEQHSGPSSSSPPTRLHNPDAPLLSPISLLANHPATSNGPPGLFYVSRGKASTNIVDADGRSVIRKAIHWRDDTNSLIEAGSDPDTLRALHVWHRIEVLLSPSGRTIMVGIGATEIQAVEMGPLGDSSNAIVIPDSAAKRRLKPVDAWDSLRDVVYLGSLGASPLSCTMKSTDHSPPIGSRIFWSERVGNQTQLHCLETLH